MHPLHAFHGWNTRVFLARWGIGYSVTNNGEARGMSREMEKKQGRFTNVLRCLTCLFCGSIHYIEGLSHRTRVQRVACSITLFTKTLIFNSLLDKTVYLRMVAPVVKTDLVNVFCNCVQFRSVGF